MASVVKLPSTSNAVLEGFTPHSDKPPTRTVHRAEIPTFFQHIKLATQHTLFQSRMDLNPSAQVDSKELLSIVSDPSELSLEDRL